MPRLTFFFLMPPMLNCIATFDGYLGRTVQSTTRRCMLCRPNQGFRNLDLNQIYIHTMLVLKPLGAERLSETA